MNGRRLLEQKYTEMKLTYKNLVNANIDLVDENKMLKEEIERLNNIINELEKWLNEKICLNKNDKDYINGMTFVGVNLQMYQMFLDKLRELKGI